MTKSNRRGWLDKISKWILDILPGESSKPRRSRSRSAVHKPRPESVTVVDPTLRSCRVESEGTAAEPLPIQVSTGDIDSPSKRPEDTPYILKERETTGDEKSNQTESQDTQLPERQRTNRKIDKGSTDKLDNERQIDVNDKPKVPILNIGIQDLELSGRTVSRLQRNKIYCLLDLAEKDEEDLLRIWHFGEKSVIEVRDALNRRGLSLPFKASDIAAGFEQKTEKYSDTIHETSSPYNDIVELCLSSSLVKSLSEEGICCIDDLVRCTEKDLLRIPKLGPTTARKIRQALAKRGRTLAGEELSSKGLNHVLDERRFTKKEGERLRLEQESLAAKAEAQHQAEEEEQARQAAEAERMRLEQERLAAEAEAQRQAEEEQARQAAEAERMRLEQERLAAEAAAQPREQEEQTFLHSREDLDRETTTQSRAEVIAETEQLAAQQEKVESPLNQLDRQVELEDWQKWEEGDWNRCLLRYCFLSLGDSDTRNGVPSSVEDLRFAVGDPQANPSELADAFVKSIINQAERHNAKPGRLFTKRAERWNPDTPLEPPFFAYLWATCLISQGYPNPYETGQFHMRYLRVFGPEQRSTFKSLKLGWEKLSQWLEQEKVLGGEEHRELVLPTELGNRTNIGYSWFLSFPSRNDRAELASVIAQLLDEGIALVPLTAQALFVIKRSGRFGSEFARTLDKQIRAASQTGVVDDWFAGIIQHEYNQLQSAADTTPNTARRSGRTRNPDLSLQLDLEDPSQIMLVLPSQDLNGLHESNQSVTFCTLDPVGTEHPWDPQKGIVSIGEDVCQVVTEMVPAWSWKLRSGSSSGYTLQRWSCEGIEPGDLPILCFSAESGQRITGKSILSSSSEAWFFAPKNLQPSSTESVEILDELRWGVSLKGWRGYLLRLTQPKAEVVWQEADESGHQKSLSLPWSFLANLTPVLRGSLVDKKERAYKSSPSLWIPPLSVPVELMLTIKDLTTNELLSDTSDLVELQASEEWTEIDLTECINTESRFSILMQPEQNHPDLPSRWKTTFQVHGPFEYRGDNELAIPLITCLHDNRPISREMGSAFRSFSYEDVSDFWLARWLLEKLWPMESLDIVISNGVDSLQDTVVADHEGIVEISAAVYRYTLQGEASTISIAIQRQGEEATYVLATAREEAQSIPLTTSTTAVALNTPDASAASPKTSSSRGRPVDFVISFQPRFTGRNAKKQVADFTKHMKQLIADAGIPADELYPQSLDNDVWIRVLNRDHLEEIDNLLQDAQEECGFKILKQLQR